MADWDANSPQLAQNLVRLLPLIEARGRSMDLPTIATMKAWYQVIMSGLVPHDDTPADFALWYRGEGSLSDYDVEVGADRIPGVASGNVHRALRTFIRTLHDRIHTLEALAPAVVSGALDVAAYEEKVIALCGWAHAEWVRIQPFANGNGRTARCWVIYLCWHLGIDQFIQVRPRPRADTFASAACEAMRGDGGDATVALFRRMYAQRNGKNLRRST